VANWQLKLNGNNSSSLGLAWLHSGADGQPLIAAMLSQQYHTQTDLAGELANVLHTAVPQ